MKKDMSSTSKRFLAIPAVFMTAVLFVVFFVLFLNGFDNYSDAGFLYSFAGKGERILLAFLAFIFFILLYYASDSLFRRCSQRVCKWIRILMWLCFFVLQGFFLFYIRSYYKWDSGFVIGGAASLAETGQVAKEAYYYLSVYPNQNTFVILTAFLVKLSNFLGVSVVNRPLVFNLFNTACMDVSVFLMYSLIKKLYFSKEFTDEENKAATETGILLLLLCNPFLYLGVSYYYTITLSWIFTMGFLYLLADDFYAMKPESRMNKKQTEKTNGNGVETKTNEGTERTEKSDRTDRLKKAGKWIFAGILLGVGYELRATAVILAVAAFLIGLCDFLYGISPKTNIKIKSDTVSEVGNHAGTHKGKSVLLQKCIVISAAALLSSLLLAAGQRAYIGIDTTDTAFPTSHWIMMSLTQPGGHNAEDESFTASFATKEEKETAVRNRMREKLQTMGMKGYTELISVKIRRTFGDGMNGYTTFLADGYGTGELYDAFFGEQKDFVILWHQGYYLFILSGMLYAMVRMIGKSLCLSELTASEYRIYKFHAFCILILFGAVLFYIFWEASEQYSVPFMPVMLCVAFTAGAFQNKSLKKENAFAKKSKWIILLPILPALLFALWSVVRFPQFTGKAYAQSHTAAVQILANAPTWIDDNEELVQKMRIHQPFNHLVIQWRNPLGEENDAEYEVLLCDGSGQTTYMRERIIAAEGGSNGAGIYTFDRVDPSANGIRDYEIRIRKTAGSQDCDLQFVLYDMYGYTPYIGGELVLYDGEKTERHLSSSLLFLLSEETERAYTTPKKYIFFASVLFLIFLFMGFCCKM